MVLTTIHSSGLVIMSGGVAELCPLIIEKGIFVVLVLCLSLLWPTKAIFCYTFNENEYE